MSSGSSSIGTDEAKGQRSKGLHSPPAKLPPQTKWQAFLHGRRPSDLGSAENAQPFDRARNKKLVRKIDLHIVPVLVVLYLLAFLDRANIGNARLAGLERDLGMNPKSLQYNAALAIFSPFYVAAEIPSNLILKNIRPSLWLAFLMLCWGTVAISMGFVRNFHGLLITRAFLGAAEGGLFPGVNFLITQWYRRHECGFRMAIFFSAATAAGAFGGLFARGITELKGVGTLWGKPMSGWSWIFILEGAVTVLVAIIGFRIISDYPDTAKFLTEEERVETQRRLRDDHSHLAEEYHIKYFFDAIKDWKIWVHMFITIGIYTPSYSIALFLPTIVKNMGFSNEHAQLLTVPPYVVACVFTVTGGYYADKLRTRGPFMIGFCITAMIGFSMLISTTKPAIQYMGAVLATCGIFPNIPMGVAFHANGIGGSTKRAVGIAMHVGFGNLGGSIGCFIYRSIDAPRFKLGHATLLGMLAMSCCLATSMHIYYRRENARRDLAGVVNGWPKPEDYTEEMYEKEREKGDNATFFRFTT